MGAASKVIHAVGKLILLGTLNDDDYTGDESKKSFRRPRQLFQWFDHRDVESWEESRFKKVRALMDAPRNYGRVYLMMDTHTKELVAVKKMPTKWVGKNHSEFVAAHPEETELPWQDFGCTRYLASMGYSALLHLRGVYRDKKFTYAVSDLATGGDLCSWCDPATTIPCIEVEVAFRPLAIQICRVVRDLHNLGIVHRDLSLENFLLCETGAAQPHSPTDGLEVKVIDFAMASLQRWNKDRVAGKLCYLAPEVHTSKTECDGFLRDAFAVGVTLFAMLRREYPWESAQPGASITFELFQRRGLQAILRRRNDPSHGSMSEPLLALLDGLLNPEPSMRLTLGETEYGSGRRSVWDEPWIRDGPFAANV
mmetsp:Transcript_49174/g.95060  ORF Transcript_49174/g.95060 Transcript_49174/m.95060 type:complete len:367 (+) Transcript_49174:189-1289(+)|eukprot:CAMPEP_0172757034 /NCGR_PEP_ID=MMETSP1074-20121228/162972_1 /TAXON_ID=2916 /ORGANISM="Ceratium fusus, Strain PA161109" /LENGTH=366 /DNA_ID=CAMNT_0013590395 /DNA_START=120 /DNA_END=1220 /DNA_ORIENTATION=-